eukprot:UN11281
MMDEFLKKALHKGHGSLADITVYRKWFSTQGIKYEGAAELLKHSPTFNRHLTGIIRMCQSFCSTTLKSLEQKKKFFGFLLFVSPEYLKSYSIQNIIVTDEFRQIANR